MKTFFLIISLLFISSCSTPKPKFKKENVCSYEALRYLRNPRNQFKQALMTPRIVQDMASTSRSMQLCYEDFKKRAEKEEFSTCLVVGVDVYGGMEFYNFGSREVELDDKFVSCAKAVTQNVPYSEYGTNYILIQSYEFYTER